jgi:ribosomal protein S6
MRQYKLVLILKSDIKKETKEKLLTDVKSWLGKTAKDKVHAMGEKKFAYTISGNKKGDYVTIEFESETVPNDFAKKVQIQDNILRHLLVRD